MAAVTLRGCCHMPTGFAGGGGAVMAAGAGACDNTVIKIHRCPVVLRKMAAFTLCSGCHMPAGLSSGSGAVVAAGAGAGDATVIKAYG